MNDETQTTHSKENFLNYLSTEIEQIREDMKTPGWTQWAIIGALASIFWLLILEVEKDTYELNQSLMLFAIISLLVTVIRNIHDLTKPKKAGKNTQLTTVPEWLSGKSSSLFVGVIWGLLIVFIIVRTFTNVNRFLYYSIVVCYSPVFILVPILYLISRLFRRYTHGELYIPSDETSPVYDLGFAFRLLRKRTQFSTLKSLSNSYSKPKSIDIALVIRFLLLAYWVIGLSMYYTTVYPVVLDQTTISGFKIAVLGAVGMSLIRILLDRNTSLTTLNKLVDIRRDIVFNNIDLDVARKLTEIAIYGLNKSTVAQMEVANHVSTLQRIEAELTAAEKKNDAANILLLENNDTLTSEKMVMWESLRDTAYSHFRKAQEVYQSEYRIFGDPRFLIVKYSVMQPNDTEYLSHVEKLADLYKQVKQKYDATIWVWLNYINKFEGEDVAKNWMGKAVEELKAELPITRINSE